MKINAEILNALVGISQSPKCASLVPCGTRGLSPSCHQIYPVRWWAKVCASLRREMSQLREAPYEGGLRFVEWRDRDET